MLRLHAAAPCNRHNSYGPTVDMRNACQMSMRIAPHRCVGSCRPPSRRVLREGFRASTATTVCRYTDRSMLKLPTGLPYHYHWKVQGSKLPRSLRRHSACDGRYCVVLNPRGVCAVLPCCVLCFCFQLTLTCQEMQHSRKCGSLFGILD